MSYKYIFWDFNGTIMDDVNTALGCVNDLLTRKKLPHITLEDYYKYVDTPIIKFYYHILPPEEIDFEEISRCFHEDYRKRAQNTHLAPGIYSLLEKLKNAGVKQYIITANNARETIRYIEDLKITEFFEEISAADNFNAASKTDRAKELFGKLKTRRQDVLFIGDTLHDREVADELGIDCVLVSYGHQGRALLEKHGAFVADSAKELEEIIFDERKVDFHTHSTASDGTMSPGELVSHAKEQGLYAFALTDHDSVDGIQEAVEAAKNESIELIPGIEFSAAESTETHIIGLFIDPDSEILQSTIKKLKNSRRRRMEDICSRLRALDFDITHEEALELAGGTFVGRAHIAKLMVKKGYCEDVRECFTKYIGLGKPAYSPKNELTAVEAIKAIKASGGVAFLAHLHQTGFSHEELCELLMKLKAAGLDGIEGYYTEYTPEHIKEFRRLALQLGLILGGGSDFHGSMKPGVNIGTGYGELRIPYHILKNIKNYRLK